MSSFRAVGSNVQIVLQTKFPTFTPDQFRKALTERNYIQTQTQIPDPQNPQAPPRTVPMFSKENVNVFLIQNLNRIIFQILNTVDLEIEYEDIKKILLSLKVDADTILDIGLNCATRAPAKSEPKKNMTSLVKPSFLEGVEKSLEPGLGVTSIKLATSFPLERDAIQVILEPLGTNPNKEYYLNIIYQTTNMEKFNKFIERFGGDMIQEIVTEVEGNV